MTYIRVTILYDEEVCFICDQGLAFAVGLGERTSPVYQQVGKGAGNKGNFFAHPDECGNDSKSTSLERNPKGL